MSIAAPRSSTIWLIALLAALPIETANFCCSGMVLDPGNSPANMPWWLRILAAEWSIVHATGLLAIDAIERTLRIGLPNWTEFAVIVLSGYLTTVLLLLAILYGIRWLLRIRPNRQQSSLSLLGN